MIVIDEWSKISQHWNQQTSTVFVN
uniref:Uncharacterized protein n=1 Tax=Tetranychus urticae TaxID=32264 RepID=T1JYZ8_TETUR